MSDGSAGLWCGVGFGDVIFTLRAAGAASEDDAAGGGTFTSGPKARSRRIEPCCAEGDDAVEVARLVAAGESAWINVGEGIPGGTMAMFCISSGLMPRER